MFGSCWWGWGYRCTHVLSGVIWGCLEGLAGANGRVEKSRGVFGRAWAFGGSGSGFLDEKRSWGILTILGYGCAANLSSGGGMGLAYCKGEDRQFCAQLRADARNGVQKGGSAILSAILDRQFSRQFFGNSGSAIPRQFSLIK